MKIKNIKMKQFLTLSINNIKYNIITYIKDNLFFIKLQIDIVKI